MFENVLSTMIFLPILAGLVLLLLPISQVAARRLGLVASVIILLLGIRLFLGFNGAGGMEFNEIRDILPSLGIQYSLGRRRHQPVRPADERHSSFHSSFSS